MLIGISFGIFSLCLLLCGIAYAEPSLDISKIAASRGMKICLTGILVLTILSKI
jgi:hypothetical protein